MAKLKLKKTDALREMREKAVIVASKTELPANLRDLARFVLFGREKLNAIKANIRALDRLDLAAEVRNQKKEEAQGLAGALLDAEVRLGELFGGLKKGKTGPKRQDELGSTDGTKFKVIRDLGFDDPKKTAYRFELLASRPDIVERVKREALEGDDLPTRMECLREIRKEQMPPMPTPVEVPGFPTGPFRTIVIDPPWPMEKITLDRRPVEREVMDYPTWSLDKIRDELPIAKLGDPHGCHVHLWVTHKFLPYGLELFGAWGVRYECVLTWIKPTAQPLWWKYNTEHCLFGKIGALAPIEKGQPVGFRAPQQRHSHKPEEFFSIVRKVSPGPRITLFDDPRDGFKHWGVRHA